MCLLSGYMEAEADYQGRQEVFEDAGTLESAMRHIDGVLVSPEAERCARKWLTDYLWGYNGKPRTLACTVCGETFERPKGWSALHGKETACPRCGAEVVYRDELRGHKYCRQSAWLLDWRKSAVERDTVTLVASLVDRDSTGANPERAVTDIIPVAIYIFRYGKGARCWKRNAWVYDYKTGKYRQGEWQRMKKAYGLGVFCGGRIGFLTPSGAYCRAIAGTSFERVDKLFGGFNREYGGQVNGLPYSGEVIRLMAEVARRPYVEYMAKVGQKSLAMQIMQRGGTKAINGRGKNATEILRMTPGQYAEVKREHIALDIGTLEWMQALSRIGASESVRVANYAAHHSYGTMSDVLDGLQRFSQDRRPAAMRWLMRQCERSKEASTFSEARDYWKQLVELGEDFADEQISMPRDLAAMHQRMTDRLNQLWAARRAQQAAVMRQKFEKRLKSLSSLYNFEAYGLILRPFASADEIRAEGAALRHCVAQYISRYMNGQTILCALRWAKAPETPWRTVEFSAVDGKLVQDRGYKNDRVHGRSPGEPMTLTAETRELLEKFWNAFEAWRTGRKTA